MYYQWRNLFPIPISPSRASLRNKNQALKTSQQMATTFFKHDSAQWSMRLKSFTEAELQRIGEGRALKIFHQAAQRVPAYRDFLRKHRLDPAQIKTIQDFQRVPLTDKKSYILHYPLEKLVWDGRLDTYHMVAASSGSSGAPLFWPRDNLTEYESNYLHEHLVRNMWQGHRRSTLALVTFAMGVYTAGYLTATSLQTVSQKGYPWLVAAPGLDLADTLRVFDNLQGQVDQVVIFGYPSIIQDFVDALESRSSIWPAKKLIFVAAGEPVSAAWRDYLTAKAHLTDPDNEVMVLYGCTEKNILGHESIFTKKLSQLALMNKSAQHDLYEKKQTPNLYQYYPFLRYFEAVEGSLVFTATGGIPLMRYNIHDQGGILTLNQANQVYQSYAPRQKRSLSQWQLPMVYVWGRDEALTFYALNIYPENVRQGIEGQSFQLFITGRFVMEVKRDKKQRESFWIYVECVGQEKLKAAIGARIRQNIIRSLRHTNAEYNKLYGMYGISVEPRIKFLNRFDTHYFPRTTKHKYILR